MQHLDRKEFLRMKDFSKFFRTKNLCQALNSILITGRERKALEPYIEAQ